MRSSLHWFIVLSVATACTGLPRRARLTSGSHAACSLVAVSGISITHPQAQQAVRDFTHQQGYPYALLYVETAASSGSARCVRVVQRAENQFTYYTYQNQQVAQSAVTNASWGQSLAAVGQGHFRGGCDSYASEPGEGILFVKRDSTVVFSLALSLHERNGFSGPDKARVALALSLVQRVLGRTY
jgi:hypothetical protein